MYGIMGKIQAAAGQREQLMAHLLQAAAELTSLEHCYLYVVSRASDDADGIWVTEIWRSPSDHQDSLKLEAIQSLISAARPLIAGMPERIEFEPMGGKGLTERE